MNSGKTLKILRLMRGITQEQLGEKLGIGQQAVSKMENQKWIDDKKIKAILVLLHSSKEEIEQIKKLLRKNKSE